MDKERFWLLVSLKLSGEATQEQLAELHSLLRQFPELNIPFESLGEIWRQKAPVNQVSADDAYNKHLQRLSNHLSKPALEYENSTIDHDPGDVRPTLPFFRRYYMRAATIAASLIFLFIILYKNSTTKTGHRAVAQNTITTKPSSKSKLQLPDGTQVWLNSDSKITYGETFVGETREVQLSGEAYFDVAKDKEHPFIIHTQTIDLKVLGTAFNVRSYANEKNTETSLIHGSIEVTLKNNPGKKIILKPDEKLIIQNNPVPTDENGKNAQHKIVNSPLMVLDKIHFKQKDSSASEILWVKNKLAFDQESLETIASKIEKWYDVEVLIADDKLKAAQYSGVFMDETLPEVMEALKLTGNFRYTINKRVVSIKP